jgi:hypothetical protein
MRTRFAVTIRSLILLSGITAALAPSPVQDSTVLRLSLKPDEAMAGATVSATASGSGLCGAVHIDWGDGTAITYATSTLPVTQSHVYKYGGVYNVRAQGMGNCAGQATTRMKVSGPPPPPPPSPAPAPAPAPAPPVPTPKVSPAIGGVVVDSPSGTNSGVREIRVNGTGQCAYTLDFGDGNSEGRNAVLPDVVRHNYPARGRYTIIATPAPPCGGGGRSVAVVRRRSSARH